MQKQAIFLALVAVIAISATQIQDVEAFEIVDHTGVGGIQVSPYISGFNFYGGFVNTDLGQFYGVNADRIADLTGFEEYNFFVTLGDVEFDKEVDIVFDAGIYTLTYGQNTIILTQEEYDELNSVRQGFDSNAAPSMSGLNTRDADRVTFSGAEDVIFVMTNSEIHILNGKAYSQYVVVFFDGQYIDLINVGVEPTGTPHNEWIGIGGTYIDIPFEAYYHVTDEGQLLHLGAGYQNVYRDFNDMRIFNEGEGNEATLD